MFPSEHLVAKALLDEVRTYRSATATLKDAVEVAKGDLEDVSGDSLAVARRALADNGPPDPMMYGALLLALGVSDVGQRSKTELQKISEAITDTPPSIQLCRVDTTKEEKVIRLSLCADDRAMVTPLLEACRALEFDIKRGPASQGALADHLSAYIDVLRK